MKEAIYNSYRSMKTRCYNSNYNNYHHYGGRGIKVCDRWLNSFKNFYDDMFFTWKPGLTLDRKDNNGDYTPENCRWQRKMNKQEIDKCMYI